MKKVHKKRNIKIGRIFDLLIIPIYIIFALRFILEIKNYTSNYLMIAIIALLVILAIFLLTLLYNKKTIEYIRRIFITIICLILVFSTGKINSFDKMLGNIAANEDDIITTKTKMNLYSLASNEYFTAVVNKYDDIDNMTIGVQISNDKEASQYVYDKLDKEFTNIHKNEYRDYYSMMNDLINGYIDVAIISDNTIPILEEDYGTFSNFTTYLKSLTYTKTEKIESNGIDISESPFTVLVSGSDMTGQPTDTSLSDMNMLLFVDPQNQSISTISIPRDSFIPNPAYNYTNDKLTHTGNDGVDNTVKAIENAFQIDIDFYVKISFSSLIEIVDAVGGVEVDVPIHIEEQDENRSFETQDLIILEPGIQTLNGKQALAFSRHRKSYANQDLGRNAAQLQVIKGIIKSLISPEGIFNRIEKVMEIIPNYTLTNFTKGQMQSFIKSQLEDPKSWNITSISLSNGIAPGPEGYATVASMSEPQSVYYLNINDLMKVQAIYQALHNNPVSFNEFSFKVDTYAKEYSNYNEDENMSYAHNY